MTTKTPRPTIKTDDGLEVTAMAPVIISASRSTDIPAFYSKWFFERLKRGYVTWYNPFNQRPSYVSFAKTRAIVFWTKNPKPIMPYLGELDKRGIHYYFQYTLNDYDKENFEPAVGSLQKRIETFRELSKMIGSEKVIWRFDPIIFTPELTPEVFAKKIKTVGEALKGYTDKLVFSFIDVKAYRKVRSNLIKESKYLASKYDFQTIENVEANEQQIEEFCHLLCQIRDQWRKEGWSIDLATCAEKVDLSKYSIAHNKCIDPELLAKLFSEDKALMDYLYGPQEPDDFQLGMFPESKQKVFVIKKDAGQRKECGCVESKDIGSYNTCVHGCIYCYANVTKKLAQENLKRHKENPFCECILAPGISHPSP